MVPCGFIPAKNTHYYKESNHGCILKASSRKVPYVYVLTKKIAAVPGLPIGKQFA